MAQKNVDALVTKELQAGEEICWKGKGVPFKLIEKDTRKGLLLRWAGGLAGIAASILCYVLGGGNGKIGFVALLVGLLVLMMAAPLFETAKVQKYQYFLTNRRAMIVAGNGTIQSMSLQYVDEAHVLKDYAAGDCLVLGKAMMQDLNKQLRWLTCHPRTNSVNLENGMGMGMVFYCVNNAEEAKRCLFEV